MEEAYEVSLISDFESLLSFSCGVKSLNDFIHSELEVYAKNHYCSAYLVSTKNGRKDTVAIFALAFDSIVLDADDFEEMNSGPLILGGPRWMRIIELNSRTSLCIRHWKSHI